MAGELWFGPMQGSNPESGSRPDRGGRAGGGSGEIWGWSSLYRTKGPLGACLGGLQPGRASRPFRACFFSVEVSLPCPTLT